MASFQSEIRTSQINDLLEKVSKRSFAKYLLSIRIPKARAFVNQRITFDFPVTALIGPNGGGKSTVLGAAGIAYSIFKPGSFLAKSGVYDSNMQNWEFEYEVIDRTLNAKDLIRRSARFTKLKWNRKAFTRDARIFGVSRTVPATERKELRQCISSKFSSTHLQSPLSPAVAQRVAAILDKDVSKFTSINVDSKGKVTLLTGQAESGDTFSEFHFGAGESSVIRMLSAIDTLSDGSLILIEEIENGLHPVATVRLVENLISLAEQKSMQVIFTTHSNDALRPLPSKAIWAAVRGQLFQGKLDIHSLRAVTGQVDTRLTIFVEDEFAKLWVETILKARENVAHDALEIHAMHGDGIAVAVHKHHNSNPSLSHKSVCILDGDSQQKDNAGDLIFRLPGQSPERYVYSCIVEKLDSILGELTVALLRRYEEQHTVKEVILSVSKTNQDPHLLYSQVGRRIGFTPEDRVKEAFLTLWVRNYPEEVKKLLDGFEALTPNESDPVSIKTQI